MRILLVAKPWRGGLAYYLYSALCKHSDFEVSWLKTYPAGWKEKLAYRRNRKQWRRGLVRKIVEQRYDLALFINTYAELDGLPQQKNHVLWTTDDPGGISDHLRPFAQIYISDPGYASVFSGEELARKYCGVLPFAAHPETHYPLESTARKGTCFIANKDPHRDKMLEALLPQQQDLTVYGNYFLRHPLFYRHVRQFRRPFSFEKISRVYSHYQVSLNIHAQVVKGGTNMRTFEAAACHIPQLVENLPGLDQLFVPNEEIMLFDSVDDYATKREALRDPVLATRLRDAAYDRVIREHTYEHRVQTLLQNLL